MGTFPCSSKALPTVTATVKDNQCMCDPVSNCCDANSEKCLCCLTINYSDKDNDPKTNPTVPIKIVKQVEIATGE